MNESLELLILIASVWGGSFVIGTIIYWWRDAR